MRNTSAVPRMKAKRKHGAPRASLRVALRPQYCASPRNHRTRARPAPWISAARPELLRVPNIMKRACVASQNWQWREARCSQYLAYWQAERQSVPRRAEQVPSGVCLDATPERDNRAPDARSSYAPARSHPQKLGPLLHVPARCRFWPQPPAGWRGIGPRLHAQRFPGAGPSPGHFSRVAKTVTAQRVFHYVRDS